MKELTINFGEKEDIWDRFVNGSPQGSVFLLSDFINVVNISLIQV